ncbi:MAG TPA: hypothetical protein DC049_12680, partial [Spirochaetia bacterium]|nr:hypothetical protein [Spirochaetia bacterium]
SAGSYRIFICTRLVTKYLPTSAIGSPWSTNTEGYVDTLNPKAIDLFIRLTHEQYAKQVGKYFRKVIKGIFTDEPTILRMHETPAGWDQVRDLPWTSELPLIFKNEHGYDLIDAVPLLISDSSSAAAVEKRRDFWGTVSELYLNSYHRQIRSWCDQHGILYSGHVLSDKRPHGWIENQGDYFKCMEVFNLPAMDHVWGTPCLAAGKKRLWTTYEFVNAKVIASIACQHNLKRVCCETFALGGFSASLEDFKITTGFLGALGVNMILVSGFQYSLRGNRRRVVPTVHSYQSPWWKYYHLYAEYTSKLCRLLASSRHHPDCTLVYSASDWMAASPHSPKGEALSAFVRLLLEAQIDFNFASEPFSREAALKKNITLLDPDFSSLEKIKHTIKLDLPDGESKHVIVNQRRLGQDRLYIIVYYGRKNIRGTISLPTAGRPLLIDLEAGSKRALFHRKKKHSIEIPVRLYPGSVLPIQMAGKLPAAKPLRMDQQWQELMPLDGPWKIFPLKPNAAMPDCWQVQYHGKWIKTRGERLYLDFAVEKGLAIKSKFQICFRPPSLHAAYEKSVISSLRINGKIVTSRECASGFFDESTRERDITGYLKTGANEIEAVMTIPEYERHINYYGDPKLPPIFIFGDFAAGKNGLCARPETLSCGSWTDQGFPRYSGTIRYEQTFEWKPRSGRRSQPIVFNADIHGGVMTLRINGWQIGCRAWAPYFLDVSRTLRRGENHIAIEVTNTLANFIEHPLPSGLASAGLGVMTD